MTWSKVKCALQKSPSKFTLSLLLLRDDDRNDTDSFAILSMLNLSFQTVYESFTNLYAFIHNIKNRTLPEVITLIKTLLLISQDQSSCLPPLMAWMEALILLYPSVEIIWFLLARAVRRLGSKLTVSCVPPRDEHGIWTTSFANASKPILRFRMIY